MRKVNTKSSSTKRAPIGARASAPVRSGVRSVQLIDVAAEDVRAQHEYVHAFGDREIDLTVAVAQAFIEGMRKVGYRNTGTAIDELIDNALQASASSVHVITDNSGDNIRSIAVVDTGHGMEPQMIRLAVSWGGSHRSYFGDFSGFGKFGFGLPTASIHVGTKYTVYSKLHGAPIHRVEIDLKKITDYRNDIGRVIVPPATKATLPKWVQTYLASQNLDFTSGTIVLLEHIDQLSWWNPKRFHTEMLQHLGVYYRNFLGRHAMFVNGISVQPVDPLFTTEGCRFYDLDSDRAVSYPRKTITVTDSVGSLVGNIELRFSYIPPTFPNVDKNNDRGKKNDRWKILKAYNDGIIVMRAGRQIDVVRPTTWKDLIHRDYYWGIELNFSPSLDDFFSVSATKQTVILSPKVWTLLEQHDVRKTLDQMRERNMAERAGRRERMATGVGPRAAEKAITNASTERFDVPDLDPSRVEEGQRNFDAEIQRRRSFVPEASLDDVITKLEREIAARPYLITLEKANEGPFYRVEALGGQRRVILNTSHIFYREIYGHEQITQATRDALDTLILALGEAEFESKDQRLAFYRFERVQWSQILERMINHLPTLVDHELTTSVSLEQEFNFEMSASDLEQTA